MAAAVYENKFNNFVKNFLTVGISLRYVHLARHSRRNQRLDHGALSVAGERFDFGYFQNRQEKNLERGMDDATL